MKRSSFKQDWVRPKSYTGNLGERITNIIWNRHVVSCLLLIRTEKNKEPDIANIDRKGQGIRSPVHSHFFLKTQYNR